MQPKEIHFTIKPAASFLIPSNSFIDEYGNVVKGEVKIKYREFTSPIDFYLSSIPMDYDSAGKKFSFESFGMCEVLASKDGEPVVVNPKSKPEINVVSTVNSNSPVYIIWIRRSENGLLKEVLL